MGHRRNIKKHLVFRLKQRYGIKLPGTIAIDMLRKCILSGGKYSKYLKPADRDFRYVYLVRFQGKRIPVVYDHKEKIPVTVLTFHEGMV